jgi:predicted nucleic acid-binding protein
MDTRQYIIDTGIILDYLSARLPESGMEFLDTIINAIPNISVVTKIELLSLQVPEEYSGLLNNFIRDAIVLDLSGNVVKNTILINQTHTLDLNQAVIAATAVTYNYTLITNTTKPYSKIRGLSVVNPWEIFVR